MSFPTSLRHQQKAELYNSARYLDACDEKLIPSDKMDAAYYRACAQVCRLRLEAAPSFDYYGDLLEHSPAFRTIATNLEYEQMLMCFRAELYPELDALMTRFEGRHGSSAV